MELWHVLHQFPVSRRLTRVINELSIAVIYVIKLYKLSIYCTHLDRSDTPSPPQLYAVKAKTVYCFAVVCCTVHAVKWWTLVCCCCVLLNGDVLYIVYYVKQSCMVAWHDVLYSALSSSGEAWCVWVEFPTICHCKHQLPRHIRQSS